MQRRISSYLLTALFIKSIINEYLDYLNKNFVVLNCAYAARRIAAEILDIKKDKIKFISKVLNKKTLEDT